MFVSLTTSSSARAAATLLPSTGFYEHNCHPRSRVHPGAIPRLCRVLTRRPGVLRECRRLLCVRTRHRAARGVLPPPEGPAVLRVQGLERGGRVDGSRACAPGRIPWSRERGGAFRPLHLAEHIRSGAGCPHPAFPG